MRQRAGRLVQRDDAGVAHQRLADLHHLPLRDRQLAQLRVRVEVHADRGELLAPRALRFALVDASRARSAGGRAAGSRRRSDRARTAVPGESRAMPAAIGVAALDGSCTSLPSISTRPSRADIAAEDLQQGRFACAVLAHQAVNFAGVDVEATRRRARARLERPCRYCQNAASLTHRLLEFACGPRACSKAPIWRPCRHIRQASLT